ncbi:hypothetical protein D3C73_565860 [compost metagenome]
MGLGSGNRNLQEPGSRKDRAAIDHMLRQIREEQGIDMVLPMRTVRIIPPAEQRVAVLEIPTENVDLIRGGRHFQLGRFEWQRRQIDDGAAFPRMPGRCRNRAVGDGAGERASDRIPPLDKRFALERTDYRGGLSPALGDFRNVV